MNYKPGEASGPTAITLDDGSSWFWYHQSAHLCDNNAFIDELGVRISDIHYRFPEDYSDTDDYEMKKLRSYCFSSGCSSYSICLAVSNLTGKDYNVYDLWKDLDVKAPLRVSHWDNEFQADLISTINGTGRDLKHDASILNYKLKRSFPLLEIQDISTFDRSAIEALMDDPRHITMLVLDTAKSSICTSDGHYLTVFRKKGDKYGILSSAANPYGNTHADFIKLSSRWLSWEELTEGLKFFGLSISMNKKYYEM